MCHNGVVPVYNPGIVAPLIEHTHVQTQHIGDVDGPAHAALVGTDDHHMV